MIQDLGSGSASEPGQWPPGALRGDLLDWHSARDAQLRWCVVVTPEGFVDIRYFRSPQDGAGVTIRLTARERDALCQALQTAGPHFLFRDDSPGKGVV